MFQNMEKEMREVPKTFRKRFQDLQKEVNDILV